MKRFTAAYLLDDLRLLKNIAAPILRKPEGDKEARMGRMSAMIENGNLMLPAEAHRLPEFKPEILGFPNAKHDDVVDALSQLGIWVIDRSARPKPMFAGPILMEFNDDGTYWGTGEDGRCLGWSTSSEYDDPWLQPERLDVSLPQVKYLLQAAALINQGPVLRQAKLRRGPDYRAASQLGAYLGNGKGKATRSLCRPAATQGVDPTKIRNRQIVALREVGTSIANTAKLVGCSMSQVKRIMAMHRSSKPVQAVVAEGWSSRDGVRLESEKGRTVPRCRPRGKTACPNMPIGKPDTRISIRLVRTRTSAGRPLDPETRTLPALRHQMRDAEWV